MAHQHFYDLEVYAECRRFRKKVSEIVKRGFPGHERFLLSSQLLDASRSITANIAEGYGRFYYKESIQFCRIARASLCESFDHLLCAFDESYLDENTLQEMNALYVKCLKLLNGYISYLKRQNQT